MLCRDRMWAYDGRMASEGAQATAGISAWLVRALLVVASGLFLWWAADIAVVVQADLAPRAELAEPLSPDAVRFWWSIALFALAGLGFGLATRFPFPRPRFAFGRLLFAVVALAPAVHLWQLWSAREPRDGVFGRAFWFDDPSVVVVGAVLAGVAVASGVGARRERR
jgi:hypothetical protein